MVLATCFWAATLLIGYHMVGYPIIVRLLSGLAGRPPSRGVPLPDEAALPSVSVIVPAHNEQQVIDAKVRALAALDYPDHKLTCILALDACTDRTEEVARAAINAVGRGRFRIVSYATNVGKVAVLNDQVARAGSDIVALTDASALIAPDVLRKAAAHFADGSVGVVSGGYSVASTGSEGEAAYWRYQSDLRSAESALGGPMGAHGAFYLFRRSAWTPLPPDTINDDFVLPMTIVLGGLRAVLEPAITAHELERTVKGQEFRRRVRIGAGNLQQVLRLWRLADPRRGWTAFTFVSGKGLRGLLPFLVIAALASSMLLAIGGNGFFIALCVLEAVLVALAIWGGRIAWLQRLRLGNALVYMLQGYLASTIGAVLVLFGLQSRVWRYSKSFERRAG